MLATRSAARAFGRVAFLPSRPPPTLAQRRAMSALLSAIKHDHEEMYEYHDQYKRAREVGDVDAQARWSRQLTWEIARHAVGEEIVVYPLLETHLGVEGAQLANHDGAEHQSMKELLYELESLVPGTEKFHKTLATIMDALHRHNDDEEIKDLPQLESAIGEVASENAATTFKRTNMLVPTRSHPSAPNKPPAETLVGLLAAPVDKLRDWLFTAFPTESEMAQAREELKHRDHYAAAGRTKPERTSDAF